MVVSHTFRFWFRCVGWPACADPAESALRVLCVCWLCEPLQCRERRCHVQYTYLVVSLSALSAFYKPFRDQRRIMLSSQKLLFFKSDFLGR